MSPRGAALRVFLTTLFGAGPDAARLAPPGNKRPPAAGGGNVISWIDLLASDAKASGAGKNHMSLSAKKAKQMENTLERLAKEEFVELTRSEQSGMKRSTLGGPWTRRAAQEECVTATQAVSTLDLPVLER
jgi:hypothetical protein